ncbi:MAG TPA: 3-oxoadipate enol-lactonase [Solirubrobacter sp.]
MIPHHTVTGPEDAPVLVLSNSLGTTHEMWDAQADALAERFRLVRYDTRGHGGSPTPHGPYTIDEVGGDVIDLLDHLGVEKAHVAGLSLGGMTAMWLGIATPLRIDRLVLLCTSPLMGPPEMWRDRSALVRAQGTQAIVDATLERWLTEDYRATHDITWLRDMFVGVDDEGYANCCSIIQHMDLTANLGQIVAPTLVIGGAQDPATPPAEHAQRIAQAIVGARLEILDPGAHLISVERPDAVTDLILEHLEA